MPKLSLLCKLSYDKFRPLFSPIETWSMLLLCSFLVFSVLLTTKSDFCWKSFPSVGGWSCSRNLGVTVRVFPWFIMKPWSTLSKLLWASRAFYSDISIEACGVNFALEPTGVNICTVPFYISMTWLDHRWFYCEPGRGLRVVTIGLVVRFVDWRSPDCDAVFYYGALLY